MPQTSTHSMSHDLAQSLDHFFNGDAQGEDREVAFVLLTAKFGDIKDGRVNYISNGPREDILSMMKEFIARAEGAYDAPSTTTKQ